MDNFNAGNSELTQLPQSKRLTIRVEDLQFWLNDKMSVKGKKLGITRDVRYSAAIYLESILHATGNYNGYCYLDGAQGKKDSTLRFYY